MISALGDAGRGSDPLLLRLQELTEVVAQQNATITALRAERDTARSGHEAAQEEVAARNSTPRPPRVRRRNLGALPAHLPRVETLVDVEDKSCPCCGGAMHAIGEDTSEMLDIVPAQLRVKVIRRPRYACRT